MGNDRMCPLCDGSPDYFQRDSSRMDFFAVQCQRCGRFKITEQALAVLKQDQKPGLSSFCRRARSGNTWVDILSTNIEQLLKSLPRYSPTEKLDNLLQLMADMTPALGEYTDFKSGLDYPLLVPSGPKELQYLMTEITDRGYLDGTHGGLAITMSGWEHLEEIRRRGRASTRCFVAMWFHESMNETYEQAIAPAITEAAMSL
jgi:hypothetical protein